MHLYALKIALLIAVSLSQIAGGTPCCCFPRFLVTALALSVQRSVPSQASSEHPSSEVNCSKCCRNRVDSETLTLASNLLPSTKRTASVSRDSKCNCVRVLSLCAPDESSIGEHRSAPLQPFCAASRIFDRPPIPTNTNTAYSPPICLRPYGPSWQCIACIWIY